MATKRRGRKASAKAAGRSPRRVGDLVVAGVGQPLGSAPGCATNATGSGTSRWSFGQLARFASRAMGRPGTFIAAVVLVLVWAAAGPAFGFGETWQLVINTATTILTFLMIFLLQNTQNHDAAAVQLKLDELIRAVQGARNSMVAVEQLDEVELNRLLETFALLAERARLHELESRPPAGSAQGDDDLVPAAIASDLARLAS